MKLIYFGHSSFVISTNGVNILIDPFLDGNSNSPVKSDAVKADYIIITHGHGDHFGDTFKIAKRTGAQIICVYELANFCEQKGYTAHGMHIGGGFNFPFGRVKFTIAHHGSSISGVYMGAPAGVLITAESKTVYHTGDTGLFLDMKLIGELNAVDAMLLPIGDNFTMGIDDAVKAVEFVNPKVAIPMHFNTFPVIKADPQLFLQKAASVGKKVRVMNFGEEIEL